MAMNSPEIKVGALVLIVSLMVASFSMSLKNGAGILAATRRHHFDIENAGGLVNNGAVKMAGVKVGVIDRIELIGGKARVFLLINEDVPITSATGVEVRTDGILGDKHVEVVQREGVEGVLLTEGESLQSVDNASSFTVLLKDISKLVKSLDNVASSLKAAVHSDGDTESPMGRIVLNLEKLTEDLVEISGNNKEKVSSIVAKLDSISSQMDDLIDEDLVSTVDDSLSNIEEVTEKINKGDGTIARLINDGETIESLNEAIGGVNDLLGGFRGIETNIDVHSAYVSEVGRMRTTFLVQLVPGLDRYYELGVVTSPNGLATEGSERRTYPGDLITEVETSKRFKNQVLFTALFAKRFHDLTVKGGIMNSAGGLGLDYYFMEKSLRFSMEAFRFYDPQWRAYLRYSFDNGIYLVGGAENLFLPEERKGMMMGIGLWLTNDDLKLFASRLSF